MYGNPEITSGGNALKYYASVRIDVRKKETIKGEKDEVVGVKTRAKVVKNKVGVPYRSGLGAWLQGRLTSGGRGGLISEGTLQI